jgi:hypothetical protein
MGIGEQKWLAFRRTCQYELRFISNMPFSSLRGKHTCPVDLGRDGGIKSIIATHLAKKEEELCKGVDLLDIGGKVTYIGVNSGQDSALSRGRRRSVR